MGKIKIDKLIRSRRRTICLSITPEATIVVKAPLRVSMRYIEQFLTDKTNWINKKIAEINSKPKAKPKTYENGDEFLYLGKIYQLRIVPTRIPVQLKDELIISIEAWPHHKTALKKWYKSQAAKIIGERCSHYSKAMKCSPKIIKISNAMKRWGSCTTSKRLNFSWRLIMAPLEIVDYVVVHELAHLHHMNHSRKFWETVSNIFPDYKKRQNWLKKHEGLLNL